MPAPHPPLKNYYRSEAERRDWVRGIFDRTAADYDRVESTMAFGSGSWYRRRALIASGLRPGMQVLDIGVGTGLVAREAAAIVGDARLVTGIDPSPGMLEHARVPQGLRLLSGSAEHIPAADGMADFLSMGFALRHISDLSAAFSEFYRVLKPGGLLCLLEITRPKNAFWHAVNRVYLGGAVPLLARLVGRHRDTPQLMRYYWDTIDSCVTPEVVMDAVAQAGFVSVSRHVELGIFSEYRAQKPAG